MNELGGGWSFSSLVERRDSLIAQKNNSEFAEHIEIAELNEKINSGDFYLATNYHGDEHSFGTIGEVLNYFVQSFEDTEETHEESGQRGTVPAVYILTDSELAREMGETVKNNSPESKYLAQFIDLNLQQRGAEFNFPTAVKYYKENLKTYETALEDLGR